MGCVTQVKDMQPKMLFNCCLIGIRFTDVRHFFVLSTGCRANCASCCNVNCICAITALKQVPEDSAMINQSHQACGLKTVLIVKKRGQTSVKGAKASHLGQSGMSVQSQFDKCVLRISYKLQVITRKGWHASVSHKITSI